MPDEEKEIAKSGAENARVELKANAKVAFKFCRGIYVCGTCVLSAAYIVLSAMSAGLTVTHLLKTIAFAALLLLAVSVYVFIFWSMIRHITWNLTDEALEIRKPAGDKFVVRWEEIDQVIARHHGISIQIRPDLREETIYFVTDDHRSEFEKLWWEEKRRRREAME